MEKATITRMTFQENGNLAEYMVSLMDEQGVLVDVITRPTLHQARAAIKLYHPKAKVDPTIKAGTTNFMGI